MIRIMSHKNTAGRGWKNQRRGEAQGAARDEGEERWEARGSTNSTGEKIIRWANFVWEVHWASRRERANEEVVVHGKAGL